jgi:hypothetical protein
VRRISEELHVDARLRDVQRVVERLRVHTEEHGAVIPPDFEALWSVFELALGEVQ